RSTLGHCFAAKLGSEIVCRRVRVIGIVTGSARHFPRSRERRIEEHLLSDLSSRAQIGSWPLGENGSRWMAGRQARQQESQWHAKTRNRFQQPLPTQGGAVQNNVD